MTTKKLLKKLFAIAVVLIIAQVSANAQFIFVDTGARIAKDMMDYMPRDSAYYVALAFAQEGIGATAYRNYENGILDATNATGGYNVNVTITNSGNFTITGGFGGPITGSLSQSQGQSVTTTNGGSFFWETVIPKNPDGSPNLDAQLSISYKYTFNGITRTGTFKLPLTLRIIQNNNLPPENNATSNNNSSGSSGSGSGGSGSGGGGNGGSISGTYDPGPPSPPSTGTLGEMEVIEYIPPPSTPKPKPPEPKPEDINKPKGE